MEGKGKDGREGGREGGCKGVREDGKEGGMEAEESEREDVKERQEVITVTIIGCLTYSCILYFLWHLH